MIFISKWILTRWDGIISFFSWTFFLLIVIGSKDPDKLQNWACGKEILSTAWDKNKLWTSVFLSFNAKKMYPNPLSQLYIFIKRSHPLKPLINYESLYNFYSLAHLCTDGSFFLSKK